MVRAAAAGPPSTQEAASLELRYAGRDPFLGEPSAIFIVQVSNGSADQITSRDITVETGDKYALTNAATDGWACVPLWGVAFSCSKTIPGLEPHLGFELPIVIGTASGACSSATVHVQLTVHFASRDQTLTSSASAPTTCSAGALPATGTGSENADVFRPIWLVAAAAAVAGIWMLMASRRGDPGADGRGS